MWIIVKIVFVKPWICPKNQWNLLKLLHKKHHKRNEANKKYTTPCCIKNRTDASKVRYHHKQYQSNQCMILLYKHKNTWLFFFPSRAFYSPLSASNRSFHFIQLKFMILWQYASIDWLITNNKIYCLADISFLSLVTLSTKWQSFFHKNI